jgi:hypothetical protein
MPQPLDDIGERIDLLKMTLGMFAPSEPVPIASELVELSEEIFENWLIARGETAASDTPQEARLFALHATAVLGEPRFAELALACKTIVSARDRISAEPDNAETAERLLVAAAAVGDIYSAITGRMAAGGPGNSTAGQR